MKSNSFGFCPKCNKLVLLGESRKVTTSSEEALKRFMNINYPHYNYEYKEVK